MPALWDPVRMGQQTQSAALRRLRLPGLGDGGHHFPGQPQALDVVVPGGLVGDNAKRRGQRAGVAAGLGFGQLCNRLDLAAQVPLRHGAPRSQSAGRPSGGGRNVCGRSRRGASEVAKWLAKR